MVVLTSGGGVVGKGEAECYPVSTALLLVESKEDVLLNKEQDLHFVLKPYFKLLEYVEPKVSGDIFEVVPIPERFPNEAGELPWGDTSNTLPNGVLYDVCLRCGVWPTEWVDYFTDDDILYNMINLIATEWNTVSTLFLTSMGMALCVYDESKLWDGRLNLYIYQDEATGEWHNKLIDKRT